jgi:hypothetical protein
MAKKKWLKPELKKVDLVPEEAVLSGCKLSKGQGGAGGQGNCARPRPCINLSS